jgi:hypothetical protein
LALDVAQPTLSTNSPEGASVAWCSQLNVTVPAVLLGASGHASTVACRYAAASAQSDVEANPMALTPCCCCCVSARQMTSEGHEGTVAVHATVEMAETANASVS